MGFREILLEKVSKMDINDALKNNNVYIGAEFEFKLPAFLEKYKEEVDRFEKMSDMEREWTDYEAVWDELGEGEPFPEIPKWARDEGYSPGEDIPPPEEMFPELKVDQNQLFTNLFKEYLDIKSFPFKDYVVSPDHTFKSSSKWVIKPDGSLGLSGIEIVSPAMPLTEFIKACPKMFAYINSINAQVDEDCGFHIGVSLKNVKDLGATLDIVKLSIFMDEGYIYQFFATREFNDYARSAHDTIKKNMIEKTTPTLAKKLIDTDTLKREYPLDHYMAINIEHLNSANQYIEFRYLGATDYHRKWDRIKTIIAHYIYDLSLACDPEFKKKEYHHKLSRLLNKIQLFSVCVEMTKIINDKKLDRNSSDTRRRWKSLWETWNALYLYKQAVDKDMIQMKHGAKGFFRLCSMLDINFDEIQWDFSKNKTLI